MRVVLRQEFPLGRFHATPWRVNPFDDPHGEWPPSPWRLVRAVTARWYQWTREAGTEPNLAELEKLQAALCQSAYAFHLPADASLVQDNYWCVPSEAPVWWIIEGASWTPELVAALEQCLARMSYFGRAETLTRIRLSGAQEAIPEPNCTLVDKRTSGTVPVLSPLESATRADMERTTDDPDAVKRAVPPGACFRYAVRPPRPVARERRRAPAHRPDCHLMQFAVGWNVAPDPSAVVRLTSRFRKLVKRGKAKPKVATAVARELTGFIWAIAREVPAPRA